MANVTLSSQPQIGLEGIKSYNTSIAVTTGLGINNSWRRMTPSNFYDAFTAVDDDDNPGWLIRYADASDPADSDKILGKAGFFIRLDTGQMWYHDGDTSVEGDAGWLQIGRPDQTLPTLASLLGITPSSWKILRKVPSGWENYDLDGSNGPGRMLVGDMRLVFGEVAISTSDAQNMQHSLAYGWTFSANPDQIFLQVQTDNNPSGVISATVQAVGTAACNVWIEALSPESLPSNITLQFMIRGPR